MDTGPRVRWEFEGISIPHGFRVLIGSGYLPSEIDRGASLREVQEETERTLRRLGYFRPQVAVEEVEVPEVPFDQERLVRVDTDAERQLELQTVRIEGLPEDDQA